MPARLKRGTAVLIACFWALQLGMMSLRTGLRESQGQLEIAASRFAMALFGAVLCYVIYRCLRPLRQRDFRWQAITGAVLAYAAACTHAVVGTEVFAALNTVPLMSSLGSFLYTSLWWFWFYFCWTTAYLALSYSITIQDQERHAAALRVQAQEAQNRALRYQINPHFLFNTLNAIAALVRDAPAKAEEMVVQLSDFFRRSLAVNPMQDVTLTQEVDLQRLYLAIERTRFPDRLGFEVTLGEGCAEARVPALLLQPLVENAVKHGVARSETPTLIRINARVDGAVLEIIVENDAQAQGPIRGGENVGLRNVAERLRSRFGEEVSLTSAPVSEGGYRNTLRIPLRC